MNEWCRYQRPHALRFISTIALISSVSFYISGDSFVFGSEANYYRNARLFLIALSAMGLLMSFLPRLDIKQMILSPLITIFHTFFVCGWLATYYIFCYQQAVLHSTHLAAVLVGTTIIIIVLENYSHRFILENYFSRVFAALCLSYASWRYPESVNTTKLLLTVHLVAGLLYIKSYKLFFDEKFNLFDRMQRIMSRDMAMAFVVGDEKKYFAMLEPRTHTCFTLISDWRDFQRLTELYSEASIKDAFSSYYESVITNLQSCCRATQFFADWSADEIVVMIFLRDGSQESDLINEAFEFLSIFSTKIFEQSRILLDGNIFYDIGASLGPAKVGLLGPRGFMKTTGVGRKIGVAKRLEEEAKALRSLSTSKSSAPIIAMDADVYKFALQSVHFSKSYIVPRIGSVKNLEKEIFYSIEPTNLRCEEKVETNNKEQFRNEIKSAS